MKRFGAILFLITFVQTFPVDGKGLSFTFDTSYQGQKEVLTGKFMKSNKNDTSIHLPDEVSPPISIPVITVNQDDSFKLKPKTPEPKVFSGYGYQKKEDANPIVTITPHHFRKTPPPPNIIKSIQEVNFIGPQASTQNSLGYTVMDSGSTRSGVIPITKSTAPEVITTQDTAYSTMAVSLPGSVTNQSATLIDQGNTFLAAGNVQEAETIYKKAISASPGSHLPYIALANLYESTAHFEKAVEVYLKALEILPDNANLTYNIGLNAFKNGDTSQAIEYFLKTIRLESDYTLAYHNLGIVYFNQEQYQRAIDYFEKAVALNPFLDEAFLYLSNSYTRLGNSRLAKVNKDKYLSLNPDNKDILKLVSR